MRLSSMISSENGFYFSGSRFHAQSKTAGLSPGGSPFDVWQSYLETKQFPPAALYLVQSAIASSRVEVGTRTR